MKILIDLLKIFVFVVFMPCGIFPQTGLETGAERMGIYSPLLEGKSIGIVANSASVVHGKNVVDELLGKGFHIVRIFSPEHGFRTFSEAGQSISDHIDSASGLPLVSLYGSKKKPSSGDMEGIDIMVFDIQDVGVRFYTYISTLSYVMESCADKGIPLVVFDRPNPNGFYLDGPVLENQYSSFVGLHPVPVVYGMTIGEYAQMVNGEGWLKGNSRCDLRVIPLCGYTHQTRLKDLYRPSPNLNTMNSILLYPSLCFFEGTIISVGRGTLHPFEVFGHPDYSVGSYTFIPRSIPGMSLHPPFENQVCYGCNLQGYYDEGVEISKGINLSWLLLVYKAMGCKPEFFTPYFNQLAGTGKLKKQILQGWSEDEIKKTWQDDLARFRKIRMKYLLYPD